MTQLIGHSLSKSEKLNDGVGNYLPTEYHKVDTTLHKKTQFRFVNDFSNYYTVNGTNSISFYSTGYPDNLAIKSHRYSGAVNTEPTANGITYFNTSNYERVLAGSKHVEWFSNADINAGTANGFINYPGITSGERSTKVGDNVLKQIGGYSITNESGVTYHYALPVYAYDEIIDATVTGMGTTTNNQSNPHAYAYSWLLTAITGPDFVDRGGVAGAANGLVDENDWGYWVAFDYGRWVENSNWRLPAAGTMRDINGSVKRYSFGKKELYYLDAIKTRTHTALFVKDIRKDSKGVTTSAGGFSPQSTVRCLVDFYAYTAPTSFPLSTLRLKNIMLFKNEALQSMSITVAGLKDDGNLYDQIQVSEPPECGSGSFPVNLHTSDNVIDVTDVQGSTGTNLTTNALKIIELDNDYYDLCPSTPNSLDNASIYNSNPSEVSSGKLTLKSVKFKGKGGVDYLPPLKFYYDYQNPTSYNFTISQGLGVPGPNKFKISISNADANLKVGDIIKHNSGNWYATIAETATGCSGGTCYNAILVSGSNPSTGQTGSFVRTKNPPFNYYKEDFWGNYKVDFTGGSEIAASDYRRRTTKLSQNNLDVWNLRSIETSLGGFINIDYEPRIYNQSAFQKLETIGVTVTPINTTTLDLYSSTVNLDELFFVGDYFMKLVMGYIGTSCSGSYTANEFSIQVTSVDVVNHKIRVITTGGAPAICLATSGFLSFNSFFLSSSADVAHAEGARVKKVSIQSPPYNSSTEYTYLNGVTSFIPSGSPEQTDCCGSTSTASQIYRNYYLLTLDHLPEYSPFAPAPGVAYSQVEVRENINGVLKPEYRKYYFKPFERGTVNITRGIITTQTGLTHTGWFQNNEVKQRNVTISDSTSAVGTLEKVETYNSLGQIVNKTQNNYLFSTDAGTIKQGVIHEEYNELRTKEPGRNQPNYGLGVVTSIRKYPYYLASTTTTDNGVTTTTYNRKFDLLSGEPIEIESINSFGQYFLSRSIPAYNRYSEMGPKISNSTNRNMLTQPTATYLYKSNGSGTTSGNPIEASVTTWTDNLYQHRDLNTGTGRYAVANPDASKNIYHQNRTYVWKEDVNPDGTSKTFTDFDWTLAAINAKWIKTSEATLYDRYSHALEEKNINDQFASAKMDYKGRLAASVATNAKYNESAYSGAEDYDATSDYFGGEVKKWSGTINSTYAHTGHYSLQLNSGQYGFIYRPKVGTEISKGRTYRVRVWVYDNGGLSNKRLFYYFTDLSGNFVSDPVGAEKGADQYTIKAGNWVLLEIDIPIGTTTNYDNKYLELGVKSINSSTGYFDDFRFHPIDGAMTSFVYDKDTDLLTYILDAENMYTQYIYDSAGRLTQVYRETTENSQGKRLLSKHEYHYARPTN